MADTDFDAPHGGGAERSEFFGDGAARAPGSARDRRPRGGAEPSRARRAPIEYLPYPPTSLPHRDLLILEQLALERGDRVCEVGVGSGGTAARVARLGPAEVVGLDISAGAIQAVRELEARHPNLRLEVADITTNDVVSTLSSRFDVVFSCDTLEHVSDPPAYFRAIHELLSPGGRCFITFPNEPPEMMHGITRFGSVHALESAVREAGLTDVYLGAARLTPRAASVVDAFGWRPLSVVRTGMRAVRRVRGRRSAAESRAQRFEDTSFHEHRRIWRALSPAVNLYWYAVLRLMAGRGAAFDVDWEFRRTPFEDCQVVIRGARPRGDGSARADG